MFYIDMRTSTFKQITEDEYNELRQRYGGEVAAFDVEPDTYWYDPEGYHIYTEDETYDIRTEIVDDYFCNWKVLMSFLQYRRLHKRLSISEIVDRLGLYDDYYEWCFDSAAESGDMPCFREIELKANRDEGE